MTTMGIEYNKYLESKRSNLAKERETNRSNLANEFETNRANTAREAEQHRTNVVNEGIKQGTLDETIRANLANEGIKRGTLAETVAHNRATEKVEAYKAKEQERANLAKEAENHRSNVAKETETHRAAVASEALKSISSLPKGAQTVAAYAKFLTDYGGSISQKQKDQINKYLNAATLVGAGTSAFYANLDKAQNALLNIFKYVK